MTETEDPFGTLKPVAKPARPQPVIRPIELVEGKAPPAAPEERLKPLPPRIVVPQLVPPARDAARPVLPPRPEQKAPPRRAAAVSRLCPLGAEARALLDDKQLVLPFLYRLMKQHLYHDAVRFLAQALPVRDGVGWACQCAADAQAAGRTVAALQAARQWVATPSENIRRACASAARSAGYGTAAGSAALAAFLSGGSLVAADRPAVAPKEGIAGQALGNAVLLTVLSHEPERAPERLLHFLKKGIAILMSLSPITSVGVGE